MKKGLELSNPFNFWVIVGNVWEIPQNGQNKPFFLNLDTPNG